jgi:hypothetical protein
MVIRLFGATLHLGATVELSLILVRGYMGVMKAEGRASLMAVVIHPQLTLDVS